MCTVNNYCDISGSSMCSVNSHCDTNGEVCMQCYQLV